MSPMTRLVFYNGSGSLHHLSGVTIALATMPTIPGLPDHIADIDYWPHRGELRVMADRMREMTRAECDAVAAFIERVAAVAHAALVS